MRPENSLVSNVQNAERSGIVVGGAADRRLGSLETAAWAGYYPAFLQGFEPRQITLTLDFHFVDVEERWDDV
jgi:hypothetical protein